jgi:hypothetical protein
VNILEATAGVSTVFEGLISIPEINTPLVSDLATLTIEAGEELNLSSAGLISSTAVGWNTITGSDVIIEANGVIPSVSITGILSINGVPYVPYNPLTSFFGQFTPV